MGDEFVQQHQGLAVVARKPTSGQAEGGRRIPYGPAVGKVAVPGSA
ncbi:hypothetical protein [Streptomyces sp. NEAU-YJ-81]|nr:hypothetical protein [Streptomyces sp. NEAU-YJ-81]MBO3681757.1 hypothetical protein [Streptomyces sp. NEAU-YJ-81]